MNVSQANRVGQTSDAMLASAPSFCRIGADIPIECNQCGRGATVNHEAAVRVIDAIYNTAATGEGWDAVLTDVADVARAGLSWMVVSAPGAGLVSVCAPRSDPSAIEDYRTVWASKDVTAMATANLPPGQIMSLRQIGRRAFLASEFYNEFWRRTGHPTERLATNLFSAPGAFAAIGIQPVGREDPIEPDHERWFKLVTPHLIRATSIRCALRKLETERALAEAGSEPGVAICDRSGRIVLADDEARALLHDGLAIRLEDGRVATGTEEETKRLWNLVATCSERASTALRGGIIRTRDAGGRLAARISVIPAPHPDAGIGPEHAAYPPAAAILVLEDFVRRRAVATDALIAAYGMTPAEARVALALVGGHSRTGVADSLGVTLATLRTHMTRVFDKVGVSSRAGLTVRLAGIRIEAGRIGTLAADLPP